MCDDPTADFVGKVDRGVGVGEETGNRHRDIVEGRLGVCQIGEVPDGNDQSRFGHDGERLLERAEHVPDQRACDQ